jgi:hypothetical protein
MKTLLIISSGMAMSLIGLVLLVYYAESTTVTVRYDCRVLMGGWHPDVPQSVQEQCRKLQKN